MAQGLNGSWGVDTSADPARKVGLQAHATHLASVLHKDKSAADIEGMDDATWKTVGNGTDRTYVANLMRTYESYQ